MESNIKLGKYKHFKGQEVEVIGVAKNSENYKEEFVVYIHPHEGHDQMWVRPLVMFLENVRRDGYDGPRFEYIGG
jgi:hypothetical protein